MKAVRRSKFNWFWLMVAAGCFALLTCTVTASPTQKKPPESHNTTPSNAIEYRLGRKNTITKNSKPVLWVLVSIEPKHFVRSDILKLAQQLKKDFEGEQRVLVDIFDDYSAASVWDPVHFYELYQAARRATYYRDVKAGKEYIEFSVARGKPKKRISLGK